MSQFTEGGGAESLVLSPEEVNAFEPEGVAADTEVGDYDFLSALDVDRQPEGEAAKTPATETTPATAAATPATTETAEDALTLAAEDEAPIADWQQQAEKAGIAAGSEEEFRQVSYVSDYMRDRFYANPQNGQLYELATNPAASMQRLEAYFESRREAWEDEDSVKGKIAEFTDDEGALSEKGKKLDQWLMGQFGERLNDIAGKLQAEGQSAYQTMQTFRQAAKASLGAYKAVGGDALQAVYRQVVAQEYTSPAAWKDEKGADLKPEAAAAKAVERAVWGNKALRSKMIEQIVAEAKAGGESALAQKLLGL